VDTQGLLGQRGGTWLTAQDASRKTLMGGVGTEVLLESHERVYDDVDTPPHFILLTYFSHFLSLVLFRFSSGSYREGKVGNQTSECFFERNETFAGHRSLTNVGSERDGMGRLFYVYMDETLPWTIERCTCHMFHLHATRSTVYPYSHENMPNPKMKPVSHTVMSIFEHYRVPSSQYDAAPQHR
jgi:hypothetical protein